VGAGGDNFLCSVLYINDCPFSFGHCIACPQVALGDLQILSLFLKQKRECNFTWLDPIQCEKKTRTIFNRVQFSLKNEYGDFNTLQ
jgi:hypothetical protein